MMKQDSIPPTTTLHYPTVCGQCGLEERKLLHNIRLRGNFRRLCTSCVLRLHPQCFCPACLGVYDRSPPHDAVVCFKCYFASHPNCISPPPIASSRGPSPCSSCRGGGYRVIDCNAARLLLAAAKIASMSMYKAEVATAMEAERRAKEAAYTKKRAREALDHVVRLMGKEKRNVVESNRKVCNVNGNVSVNNGVAVRPVVVDGNVVNKVDDSNEVLKALNAVELKDNGTMGARVVSVENVVLESQGDGVVVMVMEVDVGGKDSEFGSVVENGSVKNDDLVTIAQNSEEQAVEKMQAVV